MNQDRVIEAVRKDGSHYAWLWHCPGCDAIHQCDDRWTFNGDRVRPTFRASVLVHAGPTHPRCHSFVTDGKIEFCGDTTNGHAGETMDLPVFREKHPGWNDDPS